MPSRPSFHNSHSSNSALNEVIGALSRKLTSQHLDSTSVTTPASSRRQSFSGKMDYLLHPNKKDKKRNDSKERGRDSKDKKIGLNIRPTLKSKERADSRKGSLASPGLKPSVGAKFEMIMESPPALMHGSLNYSSGVLLSGRLKLDVTDPAGEITLEKFSMVLRATTITKKPISKDCKDCAAKHETIKTWNFLSEPKSFLRMRDNQFPWSCMLDGRLPASTQCHLGTISYALVVDAKTVNGERIDLVHSLQIARAIPPGPEKASIRIFPPTNLTGRVTMSPVVHPIGKFPVSLTLSGVVEKKQESQTRWRLKKMMWRVEENSKVRSTPCERHKHKVSEGKAVQHTDTKVLGSDELKGGWKTDFDTPGGEIMLEFEASCATKPMHKIACDVDSQSGLEVRHNLIVELIVAEEFVPNKNTNLITPTGAARVLRMSFALIVTERAGMGISWDDELPPMYEDVPPSPPGYGIANQFDGAFGGATMEDYTGPDFDYVDLELVPSRHPNDPPVYRERDPAEINTGLPMRDAEIADDDEAGPSYIDRRLRGFRLDELEAEPHFRRRESDQSNSAEPAVDVAEGLTG